MTNKPGVGGEEFKITLNKDWLFTNEPFEKGGYIYKVKVIGIRRHQWYWRVLYYLTFKKYFGIECELEIIDGPKIEQNGCR